MLGPLVSDNVVSVSLTRIEESLALPPLELDPRSFHLLIGVKPRV